MMVYTISCLYDERVFIIDAMIETYEVVCYFKQIFNKSIFIKGKNTNYATQSGTRFNELVNQSWYIR